MRMSASSASDETSFSLDPVDDIAKFIASSPLIISLFVRPTKCEEPVNQLGVNEMQ